VKSAAPRATNCLYLKTIKEKIHHRVKNCHHNLLSHTSLCRSDSTANPSTKHCLEWLRVTATQHKSRSAKLPL